MPNLSDIKHNIIKPALLRVGMLTSSSLNQVTGTGLKESGFTTRRQYNGGPARGWFQMEEPTFDDCWERGVKPFPMLEGLIRKICDGAEPSFDLLETNDAFAAVMCRIKYRLIREALPISTDAKGQCEYWKKYYNTYLGAGVVNSRSIAIFQAAIDA